MGPDLAIGVPTAACRQRDEDRLASHVRDRRGVSEPLGPAGAGERPVQSASDVGGLGDPGRERLVARCPGVGLRLDPLKGPGVAPLLGSVAYRGAVGNTLQGRVAVAWVPIGPGCARVDAGRRCSGDGARGRGSPGGGPCGEGRQHQGCSGHCAQLLHEDLLVASACTYAYAAALAT